MNTHSEKSRPTSHTRQPAAADRVPMFGSIGLPAVAAAATITKGASDATRNVDAQRNRSNCKTGSRFAN